AGGFAVDPATPRNGIVTAFVLVGSFGSDVILPSNGGRPAVLLTIATAAAPASWPTYALCTRAHAPVVPMLGPPRRTTTIVWLRSVVVGYSDAKHPSAIEPSGFFSTRIDNDPLGRAAPLASIAVIAGLLNCAAGNVGVASSAATDRTPLAVLGEPTTYALLPWFPAENT